MEHPGPRTILVYPVAPAGPKHEYLLLRRLAARGGFWQGVTGGVRPGEALDEAAVRELGEETRLTPIRLAAVDYSYTIRPGKTRARTSSHAPPITEHVFLALLSAKVDPTIDPAEHDAWDWYIYEDAIRWLQWPENREGLSRCERLVRLWYQRQP